MKKLSAIVPVLIAFLVMAANLWAASTVRIPKGLSDTQVTRAWDRALQQIEPNQDITFDSQYDTPTEQQLMHWFLNFSHFSETTSDTLTSDSNPQDTTTWKRDEIPYALKFVEIYDSTTNELIVYRKVIRTDTS